MQVHRDSHTVESIQHALSGKKLGDSSNTYCQYFKLSQRSAFKRQGNIGAKCAGGTHYKDLPAYDVQNVPCYFRADDDTLEEFYQDNHDYLNQNRKKRATANKLEEYKRQISIIDEEKSLGIVSYSQLANLTRLKSPGGGERELTAQENFLEVKQFMNKYREKLIIKPLTKQTIVDKLEGINQKLARIDDIDFDFQSFKAFGLDGGKTSGDGWDNAQILKSLRQLTKKKDSTLEEGAQVKARKVQPEKDYENEVYDLSNLVGEDYSVKKGRKTKHPQELEIKDWQSIIPELKKIFVEKRFNVVTADKAI